MPIFIFLHSRQEPVVVRGEYLDIWKRLLIWFGVPIKVQSMNSEDVFNIPARSISHTQELPDAELQIRLARQAEARKKNPNPGPAPKAIVPKGK